MLRLDHALRREQMLRAVDVRLKEDAFFADLVQVGKTSNLKAAAVGQYRAIPPHETVKTSRFGDEFGSRSQVKMVGIPEDNPRPE